MDSIELTVAQIREIGRALTVYTDDFTVGIEARPVAELPKGTPAEAVLVVDTDSGDVLFHADPQGRVGWTHRT